VLGDHEDDEDVVDLRELDEGGVEEGNGEEARSAERDRDAIDPGDEGLHAGRLLWGRARQARRT
jgi:hypothetical protein